MLDMMLTVKAREIGGKNKERRVKRVWRAWQKGRDKEAIQAGSWASDHTIISTLKTKYLLTIQNYGVEDILSRLNVVEKGLEKVESGGPRGG